MRHCIYDDGHTLFVDSGNSFCGFVSSVLSAFSSFKEKAEENERKKDLLIDLLGVSDGDKCHAIDHYAYKFQKSIDFFSSFRLGKVNFSMDCHIDCVYTVFY